MSNAFNLNDSSKDPVVGTENTAKPKQDLQLLDLPLELQSTIYHKYLNLNDRLKLREIHPLTQALIDNYIGFRVILSSDDPEEKLGFLSEVAIRKATLLKISERTPDVDAIKDTSETENQLLSFDDIFFYPQYVQEVYILGDIDADFLSDIARKCTVVGILELSSNTNVIHHLPSTSKPKSEQLESSYSQVVLPEIDILSKETAKKRYFRRCKALKLVLKDEDESSTKRNSEAVLAILKSIHSPFLEKVVMQCKISNNININSITLIVAQCLNNNPSIQSFFAGVLFDHLIKNDDPILPEEEEVREIIKKTFRKASSKLKLKKLGISTRRADMILWKELISYQANLVHLSLTIDLQEGMFSQEMFKLCQNTLVQFVHRGRYKTVFNFEWIQDCHALQEVCLHNIDPVEDRARGVHAVNIAVVPEGVVSLILFQVISRTEDLIFAIKKLKLLDTLVLFKTGNQAGETGVDFNCLNIILSLRTLESILLVRFVASNPVEAALMIKIMHSVNQPEIERRGNHQPLNNENLNPDPDTDDEEIPPLEDIDDALILAEGLSAGTANVTDSCDSEKLDVESSVQEVSNLIPSAGYSLSENESPIINKEKIQVEESIIDNKAVMEVLTNTLVPISTENLTNLLNTDIHTDNEACGIQQTPTKHQHDWDIKPKQIENFEPHLIEKTLDLKPNTMDEGASGGQLAEAVDIKCDIKDQGLIISKNKENPMVNDSINCSDTSGNEVFVADDPNDDPDWNDAEDSSTSEDSASDEDIGDIDVFDMDLDNLNLEDMVDANVNIEMVNGIVEAGGNDNIHNFQVIMDLHNDVDLEEMLGMLAPIAEDNDNNNNIFIGFLLDGIIDVMNKNSKGSRWSTTEDADGHLNYNLQICID